MRVKLFIVSIFSLTLLTSVLFAQDEIVKGYYDSANEWFVFEYVSPEAGPRKIIYDPPNKVDPTVKAYIVRDSTTGDYVYNFKVSNGNKAKQLLDTITIKFFATIYDQTAPSADWSMGEYRVGRTDTWEWSNTKGIPDGIPPDGMQDGFSFKSKGLPSIIDMFFWGKKRARYSVPYDDDPEEIHESFGRVFTRVQLQYPQTKETVTRKSIGPKDPPSDFKPIEFLDYITDLKHQSTTLGWITHQGIEQSLDAKLENAKKKLEAGDTKTSKNILNAFLNEVEAQKDKHLTFEAYGLLKYNAQYLIDRL